jgi:hypothetical protein
MTTKGCKISNTGNTMVITHSDTGEHIAEYRMTLGHEASEIRQMRRAIDKHLAEPNGTIGNYQW